MPNNAVGKYGVSMTTKAADVRIAKYVSCPLREHQPHRYYDGLHSLRQYWATGIIVEDVGRTVL